MLLKQKLSKRKLASQPLSGKQAFEKIRLARALSQRIRKQQVNALDHFDPLQPLLDEPGYLGATPKQWALWCANKSILTKLAPHLCEKKMQTQGQLLDACAIEQQFGFEYSNALVFENPRAIPKIIRYLRVLFRLSYFNHTCRWYGACHQDYLNHPVQHHSEVRFIDQNIGYGLFATDSFRAGDIVGEYTGIINLRHIFSKKRETAYIMEYPIPMPIGFRWSVDANSAGNFTRFINHSESANSQIAVAYDGAIFRLLVIAKKTIDPQEEITLDYGNEYWRYREKKPIKSVKH